MPTRAEGNLLIVTNVLPATLVRHGDGTYSATLTPVDNSSIFRYQGSLTPTNGFEGVDGFEGVSYVGCPNIFVATEDEAERSAVEAALLEINCHPVFLKAKVAHEHYQVRFHSCRAHEELAFPPRPAPLTPLIFFQGYVAGVLNPVFHNVIDIYNASKHVDRATQEASGGSASTNDAQLVGANRAAGWIASRSWNPLDAELLWESHVAVNTLFARKIVEIHTEGDAVWIQDIALLLLPALLLRKLRGRVNVGLFVHAPFPSSEVFRTLPHRIELLRGMLGADHIGFHLFEYARNFLSSIKRLLGLSSSTSSRAGTLAVACNGRRVVLTCTHLGVDSDALLASLDTAEIAELRAALHRKIARLVDAARRGLVDGCAAAEDPVSSGSATLTKECKLIIGYEVVHMMSGIVLKLLAFEKFLEEYGEENYGFLLAEHTRDGRAVRGNLILVQIGRRPDSRPDDYRKTRKSILEIVKRINRKWGGPIVYFETAQMPLSDRMAFYALGDVMLTTEVRSGFNPAGFEFLVAQRARASLPQLRVHGDEHEAAGTVGERSPAGVVIMSEFCGTSAFASGFLRVNPFCMTKVAAAVHAAVSMSPAQRRLRMLRDTSDVGNAQDEDDETGVSQSAIVGTGRGGIATCANRIMADLRASRSTDDTFLLGFGFGLGFRVSGARRAQQAVRGRVRTDLLTTFRRVQRRLIVLTYSGSLVRCLHEQRGGNLDVGGTEMEGGVARRSFTDRLTVRSPVGAPRVRTLMGSGSKAKAAGARVRHLKSDALDRGFTRELGAPLPSPDMITLISNLCSDPRNHVYVSGRASREAMAHAFSACSERLGLIAESGYVWRSAGGPRDREVGRNGPTEWRTALRGKAAAQLEAQAVTGAGTWQGPAAIRQVMQSYMWRTNGARMWETAFSIVFDFGRCDPEFGTMQGNALSDRLDEILREEENRSEILPGEEEGDAGGDSAAGGAGALLSRKQRFLSGAYRGRSMDGGGPIEGVGIMGMDDDLDAMPPSASQMDLASQTSDDTTVGMAPVAKRRSGIRVLTEGTTVMVLPTGVSKAHALRDIMAHLYSRHAEPEFILVVGSGGNVAGANDEEAAFRTFDARQIYMPDKARSWTCAVGSHASEAKFFLDDPTQVVDLLTAMDESRKTGGSGMKRNAFSSASLSSRSSAPEDGRCAPVLLMTLASTRQAHPHTHTLSLSFLSFSLSLSLLQRLFFER